MSTVCRLFPGVLCCRCGSSGLHVHHASCIRPPAHLTTVDCSACRERLPPSRATAQMKWTLAVCSSAAHTSTQGAICTPDCVPPGTGRRVHLAVHEHVSVDRGSQHCLAGVPGSRCSDRACKYGNCEVPGMQWSRQIQPSIMANDSYCLVHSELRDFWPIELLRWLLLPLAAGRVGFGTDFRLGNKLCASLCSWVCLLQA